MFFSTVTATVNARKVTIKSKRGEVTKNFSHVACELKKMKQEMESVYLSGAAVTKRAKEAMVKRLNVRGFGVYGDNVDLVREIGLMEGNCIT